MKHLKRIGKLAVALCWMGAGPAFSAGFLYDCDINQRVAKVDWISPKLAIVLQENGSVLAHDDITLHFVGKPVPTKARKRGDLLILRWQVKVSDSTGQTAKMDYDARLDTKKNTVRYGVSPSDTPQRWTGRGTCRKRVK